MRRRSRLCLSRSCLLAAIVAVTAAVPGAAQQRPSPQPLEVSLLLSPGLDAKGRPVAVAIAGVRGLDAGSERTVKLDVQTTAWPVGSSRTAKASAAGKSSVSVPLGAADPAVEIFSRVELPPGTYDVEVTVKGSGRTGTAQGTVAIADFTRERLAGTELLFHVEPSLPSAPADAIADVLPALPTGARAFARTDNLTALVRLHEGGPSPPEAVHLVARLVNEAGQGIATELGRIDPQAFGPDRVADYRFPIPLERMRPGEYALSIEFSAGGAVVSREARFSVR